MTTLFSKTENGKVFICSKCNEIHVEFKNFNFNFSQSEYLHFSNYFMKIEADEWEYKNRETFYNRKIIIPLGYKNFNMMLNKEELLELKQLLSSKDYKNHFEIINTAFLNFVQYYN